MIRLQDITGIIKLGLENIDIFSPGSKKVRVANVYILNEDTLCCDFFSTSTNSLDIKMEIAGIMGFFNGLFRNDGFEGISFAHYGVKALDSNNVELIYAISSKTTAELIGKGNSIDWLKSTYFQENTEDYRLAQSKRIISEIENCLRELVKTKLQAQFGDNWWDKSLDNKLGKEVKQTYLNQFGVECNDGNILISYTFTLQLKKIISTHFKLFRPYFDSPTDFDNQMDNLNIIRREEAHNRSITEKNLIDLNDLHERLTAKILLELTTFQSGYLTENWRLKIKKIMVEKQYKSIHDGQEVLDEKDLSIKLQKTTENIKHLISYLDETIIKLKSISTPVHKKATQRDLVAVLEKFKDLQVELLETSTRLDEREIKLTVIKINDHKKVMDNFVGTFLLNES
ncbi:MAG: hypothetical protein WC622_12780 [Pedobacter sp.]|jgi:hypothetical protein|uniref:hypothetical protein n=1 Tax=Pedobacter sp. TaxID=1411316 RepID=UPI003568BEC6